MKKILIFFLFSAILLSSCEMKNFKNLWESEKDSQKQEQQTKDIDKKNKEETNIGEDKEKTEDKKDKEEANSNEKNKLVVFVWTYCPHCRTSVPHIEKYKTENESADIELMVVDRKPFPWVVKLKQNYTNPKDYTHYTSEQCWYIPSYLFLDKDGNVIRKKCWGSPDKHELDKYLNLKAKEKRKMKDWKPLEVRLWDTVYVDYVWTLEDGKMFDTSIEEEAKNAWEYHTWKSYSPFSFRVWEGRAIKWFENAVIWMKVWETKNITIQVEDAYGKCQENMISEIDKKLLKRIEDSWTKIEKWLQIQSEQWWVWTVVEVKWEKVKIDFNHPMCWKVLKFKITVKDIQE